MRNYFDKNRIYFIICNMVKIDIILLVIKQEIGLFTSLEMNKLEHFNTLKHIKNIKRTIRWVT